MYIQLVYIQRMYMRPLVPDSHIRQEVVVFIYMYNYTCSTTAVLYELHAPDVSIVQVSKSQVPVLIEVSE